MARASLAAAFAVLEACVAEGLVPGAVAPAGTATETLQRGHYGFAELTPERRSLAEHDRFDCASLTKIVATTMLALRYVETGRLYLGQRVATILPAFGAFGKADVTIRHLMTHTSGLAAWTDLHRRVSGPQAALDAICRTPLARPSGSKVVYSDLGYITLGAALSEIDGTPVDQLAQREVFDLLGMPNTHYRPIASHAISRDQGAALVSTEVVAARGGVLRGEVHDENAAAMGGVSGHAGLFSTCADLERFCRLWLGEGVLDGERYLSPATVRAATRDQTGPVRGEPSRRGLGWVLQPNPLWVPSDLCSPAAYSHTGFTGTSLLIDPVAGIFAVLLTNRVHPTREGGSAERIRTVRARFHNAVWAALA